MWKGHHDALIQKKVRFSCIGLNAGSSLISQDEGMSESPEEPLDKALGSHFIWTGDLTCL